jgi:hypothetical protein
MSLSRLKLFKILIDKAVAIDFDARDYSVLTFFTAGSSY